MTLIKSISGIRGTIGVGAGEGLNPLDIVKFTSAYATLIRKTCTVKSNKIVVGRDARISGEMVKNVVVGTLMGMGWDVVDIDLASFVSPSRLPAGLRGEPRRMVWNIISLRRKSSAVVSLMETSWNMRRCIPINITVR